MSKLATAFALLTRGEFRTLGARLRRYRRHRRATKRDQSGFVYHRHGLRWVCFPQNAESFDHYLSDFDDYRELLLLRSWLAPGDCAVDAGANHGFYALALAQSVGPTGAVVAIEPSPHLAGLIATAARRLDLRHLVVAEACLGESDGDTDFFIAKSQTATGEQSRRVDASLSSNYERLTRPMTTLDHLLNQHLGERTPAVVKIDIEGAEQLALRGARATLSAKHPPLWLIEINPAALARFGTTALELCAWFPPDCFRRWLLPHYPHRRDTSLAPRPLTLAERFDDAVFYNLIAAPADAPRRVRLERLLGRFAEK